MASLHRIPYSRTWVIIIRSQFGQFGPPRKTTYTEVSIRKYICALVGISFLSRHCYLTDLVTVHRLIEQILTQMLCLIVWFNKEKDSVLPALAPTCLCWKCWEDWGIGEITLASHRDVASLAPYSVYAGSARVYRRDNDHFTCLLHQIVFVQPSPDGTETYLVDVAWGATNLVHPILLSDNPAEVVCGAAPPEIHRLIRMAHPDSSIVDAQLSNWCLQIRCGEFQPTWQNLYIFSEEEFFDSDFDIINFSCCVRPAGDSKQWTVNRFYADILVVKHFPLSSKDAHMGRLLLVGKHIKRQIGDKVEDIATLKTEHERLIALREIFGMYIEKSDIEHIRGRVASLELPYNARM